MPALEKIYVDGEFANNPCCVEEPVLSDPFQELLIPDESNTGILQLIVLKK